MNLLSEAALTAIKNETKLLNVQSSPGYIEFLKIINRRGFVLKIIAHKKALSAFKKATQNCHLFERSQGCRIPKGSIILRFRASNHEWPSKAIRLRSRGFLSMARGATFWVITPHSTPRPFFFENFLLF
jgi:hypothetical protein